MLKVKICVRDELTGIEEPAFSNRLRISGDHHRGPAASEGRGGRGPPPDAHGALSPLGSSWRHSGPRSSTATKEPQRMNSPKNIKRPQPTPVRASGAMPKLSPSQSVRRRDNLRARTARPHARHGGTAMARRAKAPPGLAHGLALPRHPTRPSPAAASSRNAPSQAPLTISRFAGSASVTAWLKSEIFRPPPRRGHPPAPAARRHPTPWNAPPAPTRGCAPGRPTAKSVTRPVSSINRRVVPSMLVTSPDIDTGFRPCPLGKSKADRDEPPRAQG